MFIGSGFFHRIVMLAAVSVAAIACGSSQDEAGSAAGGALSGTGSSSVAPFSGTFTKTDTSSGLTASLVVEPSSTNKQLVFDLQWKGTQDADVGDQKGLKAPMSKVGPDDIANFKSGAQCQLTIEFNPAHNQATISPTGTCQDALGLASFDDLSGTYDLTPQSSGPPPFSGTFTKTDTSDGLNASLTVELSTTDKLLVFDLHWTGKQDADVGDQKGLKAPMSTVGPDDIADFRSGAQCHLTIEFNPAHNQATISPTGTCQDALGLATFDDLSGTYDLNN